LIAQLTGHITRVGGDSVVIDVMGVGYAVHVPNSVLARVPVGGEKVTLHTHMSVRQDAIALYGFLTHSELVLFEHLINVSGIGPKMALSVLSIYSPDGVFAAILNEDVQALTQAPGVGTKTAQRIILELRDRIGVAKVQDKRKKGAVHHMPGQGPLYQGIDALMALGYSREEAREAVAAVLENQQDLDIETVITQALKSLAMI
jgi:holliday junction DNA helicase RuvA